MGSDSGRSSPSAPSPGSRFLRTWGASPGQGFAVKHELTSWLDAPVDLAVGIGSQSLSVDDFFEASTLEGWLLAGRALGPLTVYGTAGIRQGSVDVDYVADNPSAKSPASPPTAPPCAFLPTWGPTRPGAGAFASSSSS
jgi:hypothetical protein